MPSCSIEPARSSLPLTLPLAAVAIAGLVLMSSAPSVQADEQMGSRPVALLSSGFRFTEQSGAELFAGVCQGCHMPDGSGAVGAGSYPSLQKDGNLETSGYPVTVVVRGQKAMPPVGAMMSDDQVAAVVNYLRTHFGNQYQDAVTAEDVKRVRP